ncbi:MAG TPA: hypothetical protein VOA78_03295 [Candidatus Dormibacteraeota bacterium]|nr:hypothetical protein [Candidatus Dormibacteraeota bacterium]
MAARNQWRDFYRSALRESANGPFRVFLADIAIGFCVQRLMEATPPPVSSEREAISIALADLEILKSLCRKYG